MLGAVFCALWVRCVSPASNISIVVIALFDMVSIFAFDGGVGSFGAARGDMSLVASSILVGVVFSNGDTVDQPFPI